MRRLENFARTTQAREIAGLAGCTLTIWLLEAGDRTGAAKRNACRFLADPNGANFPTPAARAYALLLAKDFQTAVPQLREIVARTAPSPTDSTPVALAWALIETGQAEEAAKYLQTTPVPTAPAPDPFQSMMYQRIFQLRVRLAQKKGSR